MGRDIEQDPAVPEAPPVGVGPRAGWNSRPLAFWDYDPDEQVACAACGWSGRARDHQEAYREVLDVRCGSCDTMILVVPFPTLEETREAAAAGNPRALEGLPDVEAQAEWRRRAATSHLTEPDQLPDLTGDEITVLWDFETVDDEQWQVLRHGETEIWREVAYYESYERFRDIFEILRVRYGGRLREVTPTRASEGWLYGDRIGSPGVIVGLNQSLRR